MGGFLQLLQKGEGEIDNKKIYINTTLSYWKCGIDHLRLNYFSELCEQAQ